MTFPPQPPVPKTSDVQLTPRLLERSAEAITRAVTQAEEALSRGRKGRGRLLDLAAIKDGASGNKQQARLWLYELLDQSVDLAQRNAFDHLRALPADITREPAPGLSHLTLVRAAMEAGGIFNYLTDRDVNVHELLARIAGLRLADIDSAKRFAASHTGRPDLVAIVQKTETELLDLLTAAGITHKRDKNGKLLKTEIDGHSADGDMKIAKAARAFIGHDEHDPYNLLSGGAHSRSWMLSGAAEAAPAGSILYMLWFVETLLIAWLERWAAYTEFEPEPTVSKIVQSLRFTISRAATGDFNAA
ncbi:hypothetical protein ACWCW2_20395 [Streptomyces sp. NPDC001773]|uniref:hypothetical protein n=1 Tax=Streptomyces sp. NPDC005499 TaxID=3154883 RepID=UPI0033A91476